jgi:hypothetical protein
MVHFLDQLDQSVDATDEIKISAGIRNEMQSLNVVPEDIPVEYRAAYTAFSVSKSHNPDHKPWNTYFQPMSSGTAADGTPVYVPDIPKMPTEFFEAWVAAADARTHPLIRARFNDLVWDFWPYFKQEKRQVEHATKAIDSYIDAAAPDISDEYHAWMYIERALELTEMIKDTDRNSAVKDAAFSLYDRSVSGPKYMWWKPYDILWRRRESLSDAEIGKITGGLKNILDQLVDAANEKYDPVKSLDAAERLAGCYKSLGKQADAKQVILKAGQALENKSKDADGMLATAWLELVFNKYQQHNLTGEAERISLLLRDRGKDAIAGMKKISSQIQISQEEMDKIKASYLTDDFTSTVENIVLSHIQQDKSIQKSANEQAKVAPLSSMISKRVFNAEGHVSAIIPGIQDDRDAYLMHFRGQNFAFDGVFLQFALDWCIEKHSPEPDDWISLCVTGSLIHERHIPFIRDGFEAWLSKDWIKTTFILIPVIEAVLRDIYTAMGGNPLKPSPKSGGFDVIGMGKIIGSKIFRDKFQQDVRLHLEALYTDARGMNLRNELSHGLLHYARINQRTANLVIHTMLMLAILRLPEQHDEPSA